MRASKCARKSFDIQNPHSPATIRSWHLVCVCVRKSPSHIISIGTPNGGNPSAHFRGATFQDL